MIQPLLEMILISFSGLKLSEIYARTWNLQELWSNLIDAGARNGLTHQVARLPN